jgi:anion-transporting  ArsA/GET3 family ATPase
MEGLLARELIVVTGKGGVGKSTVAAALGLAAARRGRRTIVAEVARRDDVRRTLGARGGRGGPGDEDELAAGLHHLSIDPEQAMQEYLVDQLASHALAGALSSNGAFAALAAAAPGLRELVTMGKVWELAQADRRTPGARPYDLVVLDAPATGHGVALLSAPRTFAAMARVGRIARQGQAIDALVADRARTGVIAVARAEEMPVNETLALQEALRAQLGLDLDLVLVNGVLPERFDADEARALEGAGDGPALRAARTAHRRAQAQRGQIGRLRHGARAPVATLPFVFAPALEAKHVQALSRELEAAL